MKKTLLVVLVGGLVFLGFLIIDSQLFYSGETNEAFVEDVAVQPNYRLVFDEELGQNVLLDLDNGEKVIQVFEPVDASQEGVQEVALEQHLADLNASKESDEDFEIKRGNLRVEEVAPQGWSPNTWTVLRYGGNLGQNLKFYSSKRKVTADIEGPGKASFGTGMTISNSFSGGGGMSGGFADEIKKNAGFTWIYSGQTNSQSALKYSVPAKKTGYLAFIPKFKRVWGYGYRDTWSQSRKLKVENLGLVYGNSPALLGNGHSDGRYEFRIK